MIALLTTDIGRGHPFYLDGVRHVLVRRGHAALAVESASVFDLASGPSLLAWRAVRAAYVAAGRGGALSEVYARTRRAAVPAERSPAYRLLGAPLRPWAARFQHVLVDHPVLVGALGGHPSVWYQHGEHAAPPESVALGAARTFVPTEAAADAFARCGYPRSQLTVSGLCVEPDLAREAEAMRAQRRARIAGSRPLTVAFFSSGAEPIRHVESLAAATRSVAAAGHRALVFAKRRGRLTAAVESLGTSGIERVGFEGRAELERVTASRFGSFDAFVSPPHERTNWALGLGVPMFLVGPDIGPFPPLNRAVLMQARVAAEVRDALEAAKLGERLAASRRSGELLGMLDRGHGRAIDGFEVVAAAVEAVAAP